MLMNSVSETMPEPTTASNCARSASGDTRSFSRNCRRNNFVRCSHAPILLEVLMSACPERSRRGPQCRQIRQVASQLFGIVTNHELREHPFERVALEDGAQPRD